MALNLRACRSCHGLSKARCFLCGQQLPPQVDMTEEEKFELHCWKEKIEFLLTTFRGLKKFNMPVERTRSDGSHEQVIPESLAAEVREHIGYW